MSGRVKRPRQETLQNIRRFIDKYDDDDDMGGDTLFQQMTLNYQDKDSDDQDDKSSKDKNEVESKSDDESFESDALSSKAGRDSDVSSFTCSEDTETVSSGDSDDGKEKITKVLIKPRKLHGPMSKREGTTKGSGINKSSHTLGEIRMRKAPSVYTHTTRMEMALNRAVASTEALKQMEIDAQAAVSAVGTISDLMKFGKKKGRNNKHHIVTFGNNKLRQRNPNEGSENDSDEDLTDQNGVYPIDIEYDLPAYWRSDEIDSYGSHNPHQGLVLRLQPTCISLNRNVSSFPLRPYYFDT